MDVPHTTTPRNPMIHTNPHFNNTSGGSVDELIAEIKSDNDLSAEKAAELIADLRVAQMKQRLNSTSQATTHLSYTNTMQPHILP